MYFNANLWQKVRKTLIKGKCYCQEAVLWLLTVIGHIQEARLMMVD